MFAFSFFFGLGYLRDFVHGILSLFDKIIKFSWIIHIFKKFADTNSLNNVKQHCKLNIQMFVI